MRLLIYVPQKHGGDLKTLGLDWLMTDGAPGPASVMSGPDGGPGLFFANLDATDLANNPRTHGYRAEQQDWTACRPDPEQALPGGRYWLGRDRERPLGPEALARRKRFRSHGVTLGDGNVWQVPVCQALPRVHSLDDDGRWQRLAAADYRRLCERSVDVFAAFMRIAVAQLKQTEAIEAGPAAAAPEVTETLSIDDARGYALDALAVHYFLGRDLADWLGLINDESLWRVLAATVDLPLVHAVAAEKKTA